MSRKIWYDYGKMISRRSKTSSDAMKEAGQSWLVEQKPIKVVGGQIINDKVAIVRKDTGNILGIVHSTYKCIQNHQVFSFLDGYVQNGDAEFYSAGYIGQGEKVWLLLKLNDEIQISKTDVIQKFILFSNAHDGRGAIRAYFLPLRKHTQTLLNISFGKRVEQGIQLRHVGRVEQRIKEGRKIFDLAQDFYTEFERYIEKFSKSNFNNKKVELFFSSCFDTYRYDSTRTQNTLKKIRSLYETEIKMFPSSKDTSWAWLNATINFIDYERLSKGKTEKERISNHLESLFWGSALLLKQKAWDTISSLIKL